MIFCAAISVAGAVLTHTCITPKNTNKNSKHHALLDFEDAESDGNNDDDDDSIVQ